MHMTVKIKSEAKFPQNIHQSSSRETLWRISLEKKSENRSPKVMKSHSSYLTIQLSRKSSEAWNLLFASF